MVTISDKEGLETLFLNEVRERLTNVPEDKKDDVIHLIRRDAYEFIDYLDQRIEDNLDDL